MLDFTLTYSKHIVEVRATTVIVRIPPEPQKVGKISVPPEPQK